MTYRGKTERGNNRKSERLLQTPKGGKESTQEKGEEKKKNRSVSVPLKGSAEEVCALT